MLYGSIIEEPRDILPANEKSTLWHPDVILILQGSVCENFCLLFFFFWYIHYLAIIFVEAQHLSWRSSKNSKWIGEKKSWEVFCVNHLIVSAFKYWCILGQGEILNAEVKKQDGRIRTMSAHLCECKEVTTYLPQVMVKIWGAEVQLKGKWKCVHLQISPEISG